MNEAIPSDGAALAPTESARQQEDTVRDKAERLRFLADRIEGVLCQQLDRCEMILDQHPQGGDEALVRLQQELMEQRGQWEAEREREFERLRKEANWLADAWERLEAEERRIAAQRETLQAYGRTQDRPPGPGPREQHENEHEQDREYESEYESLTPVAKTRSPVQTTGGTELAWVQFQQLRREIQQHAQYANL